MTKEEITSIFNEIDKKVEDRPFGWRKGQAWFNYSWQYFKNCVPTIECFGNPFIDPFFDSSKLDKFKEALMKELLDSSHDGIDFNPEKTVLMDGQYKSSISLDDLIYKITCFKNFNRNLGDKQVYFDGLAIKGEFIDHTDYIELI